MKLIVFLLFLPFVFCVREKQRTFIASTPAAPEIRSFLGISSSDSVDFIRWKLVLSGTAFHLQCNYGIGKPNTNGFTGGGKKIDLKGELEKEKENYRLKNGMAILHILELNHNLLHLLDADKKLLVGNGGWSYTLNNIDPVSSDEISIQAKMSWPQDSISFDGRTPCNIPGVVPEGTTCYKLKWRVILYGSSEKKDQGTCKILSTAWRKMNGLIGNWKLISGKNGRISYQLSADNGNVLLYLLKADENILLFTDANGNLLTGNEDFSYTLNKR